MVFVSIFDILSFLFPAFCLVMTNAGSHVSRHVDVNFDAVNLPRNSCTIKDALR